MSVTEFPTIRNRCLFPGTFVIFSFDPVAYATRLEDEAALQTAAEIPRKKYAQPGPLDLPQMRMNLNILVAGHAPPQEGEDDMYCTSPARCIPISPATSHPDQRAPLVLSNALPWADGCYLHTLQLVNAFVSRVHHVESGKTTVLTKEELSRVGRHVTLDGYEASPSRCRKPEEDEDGPEGATESEGSYYSSEGASNLNFTTSFDAVAHRLEGDESQSSSVDDPFEKPMKVYVEIWEDLSAPTTLGEPKNVGAAIDEIVSIGAEWERRKNYEFRSKAPLTSQWAEGVMEAREDDPNSAVAVDAGPAPHEDELKPEDAIDERIERARRGELGTQETVNATVKEVKSESLDGAAEPAAPASPVASSALGCASTNKTAGDDGSVYRRGPLQFATAKARHLKEWLKQTLRM